MSAGTDVLVASEQFGIDGSGSRVWYFTGQRYNAVEGIWGVDLSSPGVATQLHAPAMPGVNKGMMVGSGPGLLIRGRLSDRNPSDIFLFDLDGPPNQSLESAGITASTSTSSGLVVPNSEAAVSPDGRWIAYVDGSSQAAYVVPVDGPTASPPVRVSPPGIDLDPRTRGIVFAPDSSSVIFGAGGNLGAADAYIVPTSGSAPGPLRRVTDVGHAGWVNELFYVSPSTLMIRGNLLADNPVDAFVLNLNDPTLTPVRLTNPRDSGRSHVFGVFLP
jgi:hypothetical protein